jgi:hypothetical protein
VVRTNVRDWHHRGGLGPALGGRHQCRGARAAAALIVLLAGCSSPTAPTPAAPPAVVAPPVSPPVVTLPPVAVFPPTDPRFDLTFYRQFVHNGFESPQQLDIQWRQRVAPRIYLRTIHANGRPMDEFTLNETAAALINTAGSLTGVFGLAGLERGTGTKAGEPGWITVAWLDDPEGRACGRAAVGGDWIDLYTNTPGCRCSGGPAIKPVVVKHELGHALGFRHTGDAHDLMHSGGPECDMNPSTREIYHAAVAYGRPLFSLAP